MRGERRFPTLHSAIIRLGSIARWIGAGLGEPLPDRLRRFGFRPWADVETEDSDAPRNVLLRSPFGAWELAPNNPARGDRPIVRLMRSQLVYCIELDLPVAAAMNVDEAIAFRLREASPFPLNDLVWRRRFLGLVDRRRLRFEIAMARRSRVEERLNAPSVNDCAVMVVDGFDRFGAPRHVFARSEEPFRPARYARAFAWGSALIAALIASSAWSWRLDAEINDTAAKAADLRTALRAARGTASDGADLESVLDAVAAAPSLGSVLAAGDERSDGLVVLSLSYDADGMEASGLTDAAAPTASGVIEIERRPSQRPGFDAVTWRSTAPFEGEAS